MNNIYINKYSINYLNNIAHIRYNPKLLLNISKNKIYFYILNHYYKSILYFSNIINFKKIYNIKTM